MHPWLMPRFPPLVHSTSKLIASLFVTFEAADLHLPLHPIYHHSHHVGVKTWNINLVNSGTGLEINDSDELCCCGGEEAVC